MELDLNSENPCETFLKGFKYLNSVVGHYYLGLGREYTPAPLPKGMVQGTPRQCYMNAGELALSEFRGLRYAEGYACCTVPVPVHHAWLVDDQGRAFDPTWGYVPEARYFGVVFRPDALADFISTSRVWGVFSEGFTQELLEREFESYLEEAWLPPPPQRHALREFLQGLLGRPGVRIRPPMS